MKLLLSGLQADYPVLAARGVFRHNLSKSAGTGVGYQVPGRIMGNNPYMKKTVLTFFKSPHLMKKVKIWKVMKGLTEERKSYEFEPTLGVYGFNHSTNGMLCGWISVDSAKSRVYKDGEKVLERRTERRGARAVSMTPLQNASDELRRT
ncbi:hypothetical protein F2P79_006469 [Pimephales promelas]|nr:hypothetical protein F2P79_006469 [Pimephales promelas]